jgi:thioredoxin-related protein
MERESWTKSIEVSSNLAVLLVAMVLLGAVVSTRWLARPGKANFENGLQKGQVLAQLPSIDYSAAPQTVVLAISTNCSYCKESLPFYKRLLGEQQSAGQRTRMVAVFPNPKPEVEQYKEQNQLYLESVPALNYSTLNVTGTPTLILVDSTGRVLDFWVGKLSKDEEQQVIEAVVHK